MKKRLVARRLIKRPRDRENLEPEAKADQQEIPEY